MCATITTSDSNANYLELLKCPQQAGLKWKLEDSTGVCAQTHTGWMDWQYRNGNGQSSLGFYLDTFTKKWDISPAMKSGSQCFIRSYTKWKDTTSVKAYRSTGSITVFYYTGSK